MPTQKCPGCTGNYTVTKSGRLRKHMNSQCITCPQTAPVSDPAPTVEIMDDTAPVTPAEHQTGQPPTVDEVASWQALASAAAKRYLAAADEFEEPTASRHPYEAAPETPVREVAEVPLPADDPFEDPTSPAEAQPVMGVSGQPKEVLRDHLGRYAVVLPGATELEVYKSSGNPVGRTRATTFNKSGSDKKNINDWGKRNVLIGASRRRDLVLQATGLTHEADKDRLNALVLQLEETAGSKVGSDLGTYLHEFTEYMDAGLKTWQDAPQEFRRSLCEYEAALRKAGLEPVTSLIERTVIIREYGWVCGTFDRIFFHRPSGKYLMGDLKTGKTMEWGKNEIECQLWLYAHGVNQNGVYDWNTRTWGRPETPEHLPMLAHVSETVGVVIHMPVQGPLEGTVTLLWADLASGAAHAQVCADVRARPGGKMKAWGDGPAPAAVDWEALFAGSASGEEATRWWREAKAAGIAGIRLNELIEIARAALRARG